MTSKWSFFFILRPPAAWAYKEKCSTKKAEGRVARTTRTTQQSFPPNKVLESHAKNVLLSYFSFFFITYEVIIWQFKIKRITVFLSCRDHALWLSNAAFNFWLFDSMIISSNSANMLPNQSKKNAQIKKLFTELEERCHAEEMVMMIFSVCCCCFSF